MPFTTLAFNSTIFLRMVLFIDSIYIAQMLVHDMLCLIFASTLSRSFFLQRPCKVAGTQNVLLAYYGHQVSYSKREILDLSKPTLSPVP